MRGRPLAELSMRLSPRRGHRAIVLLSADPRTPSLARRLTSSPPHPTNSSVSFLFSPCFLVPCESLANREARLNPPVLDCSWVDLNVALQHRLPPRHHAVRLVLLQRHQHQPAAAATRPALQLLVHHLPVHIIWVIAGRPATPISAPRQRGGRRKERRPWSFSGSRAVRGGGRRAGILRDVKRQGGGSVGRRTSASLSGRTSPRAASFPGARPTPSGRTVSPLHHPAGGTFVAALSMQLREGRGRVSSAGAGAAGPAAPPRSPPPQLSRPWPAPQPAPARPPHTQPCPATRGTGRCPRRFA